MRARACVDERACVRMCVYTVDGGKQDKMEPHNSSPLKRGNLLFFFLYEYERALLPARA